jgi:beta-alanine--pyruvate transaminase
MSVRKSASPSPSSDLQAWWMPFTANRQFKSAPRLLVAAKDMHYTSDDGRKILDGTAGLWCVNAGHCREPIVQAIQRQAAEMDFAPPFQMGHPKAFELAERLADMMPGDLDHVFFANSGSEAVETALKIAIAYHRQCGEGRRVRLIGRERGYHGVNFGGNSVGGVGPNRKAFGLGLPGVDHLAHTHHVDRNAYSRGQPAWGAHLADELERLATLHDASSIAAVIVEPVAGSNGVIVPPKGYLQRLRELCDKHGILLIFDEVITGFGRTGSAFAATTFEVMPDIVTVAKGLTNAAVPMGAAIVRKNIYNAFMTGPEHAIELFHGYTYSGHPLASAAGIATLDLYRDEGIFENAKNLSGYWEDAVHSLKGSPHVIDLRNIGIMAGIELAPLADRPGQRAYDVFLQCYQRGLLVRAAGDIVALSPPLILTKSHIDEMFGVLGGVLKGAA